MKGFINAKIYVEGKGIVKTDLAVENGKIVEIGDNLKIDEPYEISENCTVVPGFIDEHIHGAGGADAMDKSVESLGVIARSVVSEGTTCFLATTMTQSVENITDSLSAVSTYCEQDFVGSENYNDGAKLLGVHLEGPFISPKHVGAQPLEYVQTPSVEAFEKYNKACGGRVKIVSLAPEMQGADELITYLKNNGIVASCGHSGAKYADISNALSIGLSCVTHTYNAQTPLHHREVGVVGSAMLLDELNCEIICDTIHVCPPAIKLLIKNKPHDKITLITDAMRAKNMPDGESELGGQKVFVNSGEARLSDGTLAGSVLKMNVAIKNVVQKVGVSFCDAIDFATINPAKNLNIDGEYGSIKVGKFANFAVLNDDFEVLKTIREGKVVFSK